MTHAGGNDLDKLLDRVAAGELDALRPDEIAALERHLNADPPAAAALADLTPAVEPALAATAAPTPAEWERVWDRIESAASTPAAGPHAAFRVIRFWQPLLAAAACLVLMFSLQTRSVAPRGASQIRLSDDVVVSELEVYDDADALVMYDDDGSGRAIIWVFEDDHQGA